MCLAQKYVSSLIRFRAVVATTSSVFRLWYCTVNYYPGSDTKSHPFSLSDTWNAKTYDIME